MLIGAGHAHLLLLRRAAAFRRRGHALTILAPRMFWYSGLATGMLTGQRDPAADQVDVAVLAERAGVRWIEGEAVGLDRPARQVLLQGGARVVYDAVSFAVGSVVRALPGAADNLDRVFAVKPIARLLALRQALERRFAAGQPVRVVVAGGGITGCEVAAAIAGLAARRGGRAAITLLIGGRDAAAWVQPGVSARPGTVFSVEADHLTTSAGPLPYDILVLATGLLPHPLMAALGLPLGPDGGLLLDHRLRSPADARVHGAGDCVCVPGPPLPRAGVFAVRQAPVLRHNLLGTGRARRFRPRRRYLWIMNLGDGRGLARYGALRWTGRLALRLKDWLDLRFIQLFR